MAAPEKSGASHSGQGGKESARHEREVVEELIKGLQTLKKDYSHARRQNPYQFPYDLGRNLNIGHFLAGIDELESGGSLDKPKYQSALLAIGADPIIRFAMLPRINASVQTYEQDPNDQTGAALARDLRIGKALGMGEAGNNSDFQTAAAVFSDWETKYQALQPVKPVPEPTEAEEAQLTARERMTAALADKNPDQLLDAVIDYIQSGGRESYLTDILGPDFKPEEYAPYARVSVGLDDTLGEDPRILAKIAAIRSLGIEADNPKLQAELTAIEQTRRPAPAKRGPGFSLGSLNPLRLFRRQPVTEGGTLPATPVVSPSAATETLATQEITESALMLSHLTGEIMESRPTGEEATTIRDFIASKKGKKLKEVSDVEWTEVMVQIVDGLYKMKAKPIDPILARLRELLPQDYPRIFSWMAEDIRKVLYHKTETVATTDDPIEIEWLDAWRKNPEFMEEAKKRVNSAKGFKDLFGIDMDEISALDLLYRQRAGEKDLKLLDQGNWMVVDGVEYETMYGEKDRIPDRYEPREAEKRASLVGKWNGNDGKITVVLADGRICIGLINEENVAALEAAGYEKDYSVPTLFPEGDFPTDPEIRRKYEDFIKEGEGTNTRRTLNPMEVEAILQALREGRPGIHTRAAATDEEEFTLNQEERQRYDQIVTKMRELFFVNFSSRSLDFYSQMDELNQQLDKALRIPPNLGQRAVNEARERCDSAIKGYLREFLSADLENSTAFLDRIFQGQPASLVQAYEAYKTTCIRDKPEGRSIRLKIDDPEEIELDEQIRAQQGIRSLAEAREASYKRNSIGYKFENLISYQRPTPKELRQALISLRQGEISGWEDDLQDLEAENNFCEEAAEKAGLKIVRGKFGLGYQLTEATLESESRPADAGSAETEAREVARQQALDRVRSYAHQEWISD